MHSTLTSLPARPAASPGSTGRRLIGALGFSAAGGVGIWLGGTYLIDLLQAAPSTLGIDTLTTAAILAVGLMLATWYTLSGFVAAACLAARLTGLVWAGGESWVRRRGAPVVRRLLGAGAGAALLVGGMISPASAEQTEDARGAEPSPVHLTWAPTSEPPPGAPAGGPSTPEEAAPESDQPAAPGDPGPTPPEPEGDSSESDSSEGAGNESQGDDGEGNDDGREHPSPKHSQDEPTTTQPTTAGDGTPSAPPPDERVMVQPGDTLWSIAAGKLGPDATDAQIAELWPQWHRANAGIITDPDLIHPGQQLSAPDGTTS